MIEYVEVAKAFETPVLRGVSLEVKRGEKLGVVGPSGTGKSVLLKTTNGLVIPDSGDVRIEGESLYRGLPGTIERKRSTIGYVFQNAALFDSMDVAENVAMGIPEEVANTLGEDEIAGRVAAALAAVRLDPSEVLPKLPSELSGGMRKRVGLARAVVGRPRILLYDEPVTGLDPVTSAAVERLIRDLASDLEATSVIVTHDIEGALELCDRIALLHRGCIRFVGPPDEFRKSPDRLVRAFVDRGEAERALNEEAW